ncbi:MAG TPA: glutamyl-tRNA reductase [Rubrobacteraceae bacterium]|nr:glutamyl-tRNA reductase [Rubrobacteraceae bacterium]
MFIAVAGMNHRSAPVEVRERVAFSPCASRRFLRRLKEDGVVSEAVLLSTCNRTELYAVVEGEGARRRMLEAIAEEREIDQETLEQGTYWLKDSEAVRHLYRVTSSLDSMVVGESQILGQVREAYRAATEEQCTGQVLNRLFHTSLRAGKRIRTQTGIGDSSISVPHVAVKLAEGVFTTLAGRRALVLGAGEMSELVIKHLKAKGVGHLKIANRTADRAKLLAERVGGVAVGFDALAAELAEVDVVVSSTGSGDWIVDHDLVAEVVGGRKEPLFFVDIAVPRDVDPAVQTLDKVYVYDVDDLQSVVDHNAGDRSEAAKNGEALVQPAVMEYMSWLSTRHAAPFIQELRDGADKIRRHEISRTLKRLNLAPEEAEAVERMSHSLVNKLLHGPISELKALAEAGAPLESEEVRRHLLRLRGLEVELHRTDDPKRL